MKMHLATITMILLRNPANNNEVYDCVAGHLLCLNDSRFMLCLLWLGYVSVILGSYIG